MTSNNQKHSKIPWPSSTAGTVSANGAYLLETGSAVWAMVTFDTTHCEDSNGISVIWQLAKNGMAVVNRKTITWHINERPIGTKLQDGLRVLVAVEGPDITRIMMH